MSPRLRRPVFRLARALGERRVLVVCGSGGVGKTTTAAALGLKAALDGRRVLVCTIDPSRRLATSLGLQSLSGRPRVLDIGKLGPDRGGRLSAMTLDTKQTFDSLVERYTKDEAARKRILGNRFYREVSSALAGSHEYMAMEKLLELAADDRYDLVVLDTPPTRNALDFLEAPDRLLSFLDSSVLRYFLRPYFVAGRLTLKVATQTGALALKLADRFMGLQFLQDLSEFFLAFESMYDGFKERAERVFALLRHEASGFVLVAGPSGAVLDEALYFHRRLLEKRMPFVAFVVKMGLIGRSG
jgi:anion-transporting  ArsA/GET3 family ATPase